eukprot:GHVN01001906.1.p1 GENE.GHVN01001906.1~~GHVN01001906.1.p1  ORF type:complete len:1171 (-),score=127.91 GHVN01001906.1:9671-13183(-)
MAMCSNKQKPVSPAECGPKFLCTDTDEEFYSDLCGRLQSNNEWLKAERECTPDKICRLLLQIQLTMDQLFGVKGTERGMPKIPAVFFRETSPHLESVLVWAFEFRLAKQHQDGVNRRWVEIFNDKNRPIVKELLATLSKKLLESELWKPSRVFFLPDDKDLTPTKIERLSEIVKRQGGFVASSSDEATHVVLSDPTYDPNDSEDYCRSIQTKGSKTLVHWWYHPDSYDSWQPKKDKIDPESLEPLDGRWKVGPAFVEHLDKFNEWMNELDYEVTEQNLPADLSGGSPQTVVSQPCHTRLRGRPARRRSKRKGSLENMMASDELEPDRAEPNIELADSVKHGAQKLEETSETHHSTSQRIPRKRSRGFLSTNQSNESQEGSDGMGIPESTCDTPSGNKKSRVEVDGGVKREKFDPVRLTVSCLPSLRDCDSCEVVEVEGITDVEFGLVEEEGEPSVRVTEFFQEHIAKKMPQRRAGRGRPARASTATSEGHVDTMGDSGAPAECGIGLRSRKPREAHSDNVECSTKETVEVPNGTQPLAMRSSAPPSNEGDNVGSTLSTGLTATAQPYEAVLVPLEDLHSQQLLRGGRVVSAPPGGGAVAAKTQSTDPAIKTNAVSAVEGGYSHPNDDRKQFLDPTGALLHPLQSVSQGVLASSAGRGKGVPILANVAGAAPLGPNPRAPQFLLPEVGVVSHTPVTSARITDADGFVIGDTTFVPLPEAPSMDMPPRPSEVVEPPTTVGASGLDAQSPAIFLPTCSRWFKLDGIHALERERLPLFFMGSSLPPDEIDRRYMEIRNAIVEKYRAAPRRYLTLTECRKIIDGDASLLTRLVNFLELWGVINFQVDPETMPPRSRKMNDFHLAETKKSANVWRNPFSTNTPHGPKESSAPGFGAPVCGGGPFSCAACGKVCLYSYHVIRPGGTPGVSLGVLDRCVWCLGCFADGRYPSLLSERNFMKVDLPMTGLRQDNQWTIEQHERLIAAIEMYHENWDEVSKHVKGKTPQQCVAYFISLPIEEPFLECSDGVEALPFLTASSPLISQVSFLAAAINPTVASSAAKATLNSVAQSCLTLDCDVGQPWNADATKAACVSGLTAAAERSRQLAQMHELQITKMLPQLLETQIKDIEYKIEKLKALNIRMSELQISGERRRTELLKTKRNVTQQGRGFPFESVHG